MLMRFLRRLRPYLFLAGLLAFALVMWIARDRVLDWAAMRNYQPSADIAQLVADTDMTPYARRLFYVNRPVIEGKDPFNKHCTDPSEQVAVLGCYTGDRHGIYLYEVTDTRLNGIQQVTASHEMLHQAYDRLATAERKRIDGLLQSYHDLSASQELKDKIASYKFSEPNDLLNEMHSIFGTEAVNLPSELEEYYKQYFNDRQKILVFHQQYQTEFDKRIAQIQAFDGQLTTMKTDIEVKKADLKARESQLQTRRNQLDAYLAANEIQQYNAAVPGFNALVVAYRARLQETNNLVDEFNQILGDRNALAVQQHQLEAAIDSHVTPAQGQ
jgi:hypothetical protein